MYSADIGLVMDAHTNHPTEPEKAYRKWDEETPYFIHPLWCAMTIATETNLDRFTREMGIQVLLYHDILEDTTQDLHTDLHHYVRHIVNGMTFEGGSVQEMKEIWDKPKEIRLYKLYDKVNNLMDGGWMSEEKRKRYEEYTQRLCTDVEKNYGKLNITKIAMAVTAVNK